MAPIIVTGGGGMLAHSLVAAMRRRGWSCVAVARAECDITDEQAVARLFQQHRPAVLINCAAYTKVDQAEKEPELADACNGQAVGRLAELSKQYGTRIVHYSTDFVFDGSQSRPYRTDDPVCPLSAYGRSKLLGEQKLRAVDPPAWMIIRTAWLYGTHGPCFPRTILERARSGQPLKVVNDQTGSPTFTYDLAEATLDLLDRNASGLWHATNAGSTTWFEFATAILNEFGMRADIAPCTSAEWQRIRPDSAPRPPYSVLDIQPFEQCVGRTMRNWRDALRGFRNKMTSA